MNRREKSANNAEKVNVPIYYLLYHYCTHQKDSSSGHCESEAVGGTRQGRASAEQRGVPPRACARGGGRSTPASAAPAGLRGKLPAPPPSTRRTFKRLGRGRGGGARGGGGGIGTREPSDTCSWAQVDRGMAPKLQAAKQAQAQQAQAQAQAQQEVPTEPRARPPPPHACAPPESGAIGALLARPVLPSWPGRCSRQPLGPFRAPCSPWNGDARRAGRRFRESATRWGAQAPAAQQ